MSGEAQVSDSPRGYLSEDSRRRFTLVAGILGGVFFLAQMLLPVLLVLLIMLPTMLSEFTSTDFAHAALWRGDLWFVEDVHKIGLRDGARPRTTLRLRHARLGDLELAAESVALDLGDAGWRVSLLPQGERLWLIGFDQSAFYEAGALTRLRTPMPAHASRPFLYQGAPAVVTLGRVPRLARLAVRGDAAKWQSEPIALDPPLAEDDVVQEVKALPIGDRVFLFAAVSGETKEARRLYYREMTQAEWLPLSVGGDSCSDWAPVAIGNRAAVASLPCGRDSQARLSIVTVGAGSASQRQEIGPLPDHGSWSSWGVLSAGRDLLLVSEEVPDGRKLIEVSDGRVVRSVRKGSSFLLGDKMAALMIVPQFLPALLSLALAFILTREMRRHRVQSYVAGGVQRTFATLWQRAWAQVIDALVLGLGFIAAGAWIWRMFSDPEQMIASHGRTFPLVFIGLLGLGLLWMLLTLVAFSYFEGRFGKTPGKWLLRIRVVGTDLAPCGFGRALVRNLLTFVDGFFNFLVGVLLVALTENWQRLGDLAARTLVVADERPHFDPK